MCINYVENHCSKSLDILTLKEVAGVQRLKVLSLKLTPHLVDFEHFEFELMVFFCSKCDLYVDTKQDIYFNTKLIKPFQTHF